MKYQVDGDQLMICADSFVNLQESPAIFIPMDSELAKEILSESTRAGYKLLPCPFCGCEAYLFQNTSSDYEWSVNCKFTECGVQGPTCKTPKQAAARWNMRGGYPRKVVEKFNDPS